MSAVVHARVVEHLQRLRLGYIAERIDAVLNEAAKREPTYLDFLDQVLRQEVEAKQRKRVAMGVQSRTSRASRHSRSSSSSSSRRSISAWCVSWATGRFISSAENVLIFGPPGVGKRISPSRSAARPSRRATRCSSPVRPPYWPRSRKPESDGQLADRLLFYTKPKLLVIDELGYLPFERRSAHLFFQLVARRYERGSLLITTNQLVTQWGTVFGDEVLAAAILDRLLHHSHTLMIQGDSYRLKQKRKAV